ncbi:DUF697 domain-containing protein [Portibacter lacus]|uniref:Uncharacterized protein n=1 Tax=Portibacter lacus TaxID=1099794 RepID=A0AA37SLN2_9BACT|nr:DUF697 domain-containing protein [Portibacter lacus]GLR15592.1 hypothetical protein GCM10007940_02070 [Portibacter lacus]
MDIQASTSIIADTTAKISAISALPIPLVDVAGMTYFQYTMVQRLADEHGVKVDDTTNLIISSLLSSLISKLITTGVTALASKTKLDKMLQDSLIRASISGFLTTITGEVYDAHFRKGGNLDNITLNSFVSYFQDQFSSDRWSFNQLTEDFMQTLDSEFA